MADTLGMKRLLSTILELIYPERCAACDTWLHAGPGLCPSCAESLYPLGSACPVCADPQQVPIPITCSRCLAAPPPFGRVLAPWRYGGELAVALRRFKYGGPRGEGRRDLARPLAALLGPAYVTAVAEVDVVVPVPLHPKRLRSRGFSQAQALCAAARRHTGLATPPLRTNVLTRTRHTDEQAGLPLASRARNVVGAFRATRRLDDLNVLLVDDVVTTGATAAACARALRQAGAAAVNVLALARAEQ